MTSLSWAVLLSCLLLAILPLASCTSSSPTTEQTDILSMKAERYTAALKQKRDITWAAATTKAQTFVAGLRNDQKTDIITGVGTGTRYCAYQTAPVGSYPGNALVWLNRNNT
eukprot:TRINITY_DN14362_c0_g1_i1.p1 TRINITY_DN14362_c0_g1~~TRINITY_DN14362_c0_g1_i1.p1  ORF type:complete len:112 (+),score=23.65 TRINITY_DN14362_c0_g1_i1:356-691(+)